MTNSSKKHHILDEDGLGIGWLPPYSNDRQLLRARVDFFKNTKNRTMKYIKCEYTDFIKAFENSLKQNKNISIKGFENFKNKDVITGCQDFLNQLIMTYGLDNIQVLKGGYGYYKRLNPNFHFSTLDTLEAGKPLILEHPFSGNGAEHPDFRKIIEKSNKLNIEVYLDCAWLPTSWDMTLDLNQPCIKGIAMSLSKCFGLHWSRIGVRWMKEITEDTIRIENKFKMLSFPSLMVGQYYLDNFPMNYVVEKYKDKYFQTCKELNLTPTNNIISAYSKEKKTTVGIANALMKQMTNLPGND